MKSKNNSNKVPIMLLFFNRPDCLRQVFDAVKKYQPKQLFLVQDGPRNNHPDDQKNIEECRKIVEEISWECDIYKNYSNVNMGCDYREFSGISWCFEYVDRLIIFEDDCVPTRSFFNLCEECLEEYKNITNIHSIAGFNRIGTYNGSNYDYVFSKIGAGIGWATWRRTWNLVKKNEKLDFLDNEKSRNYLRESLDKSVKKIYGDFVDLMFKTRPNDIKCGHLTSWECLAGFALATNDMLVITPTKNMIKYIGINEKATHSHANPSLLPHRVAKSLLQPSHEITGSISHPPFVIRDKLFERKTLKVMKSHPILDRLEVGFRKLLFKRRRK